MSLSKISFPKIAVGSIEGGGSKMEASIKPAPRALSSKIFYAKLAPSRVGCNSKTNVDMESAISSLSLKEVSVMMA